MKPEAEENIPMSSPQIWPRRSVLAAIAGGGVGGWLWWKTRRSFDNTISLEHSVLENLPGGWVEVRLPKDLSINELAIEVRDNTRALSRVTDWVRPKDAQETLLLQMDLPGTKWEAGSYDARLLVRQKSVGRFTIQVERATAWFQAFELRGAIWFG